MAGGFGEPSVERCKHYARFAAHLGRTEFDIIYWLLFVFTILMLFTSSWSYNSAMERASRHEVGSREHKAEMKRCLLTCAIYVVPSVAAVVMEVYALLALQFCDGEDLMALYWSTWTVMQVGGLIAMLGILLACFNQIRGRKQPPWALALGTPVLVVAGLGHALHGACKKRVKRAISVSSAKKANGSRDVAMSTATTLPMSRANTVRAEESESDDRQAEQWPRQATIIGFTPDGGVILQFPEDPGEIDPARGSLLGRDADGRTVVAFRQYVMLNEAQAQLSPSSSASSEPMSPEVDLEKGGQEPPTPDPRRRSASLPLTPVESRRISVVRIQDPEPAERPVPPKNG